MPLRTHLDLLQSSAVQFPYHAAFKIPILSHPTYVDGYAPLSPVDEQWVDISYTQFLQDVEEHAKHWSHILPAHGILQRSTVGIWCAGLTYTDVCHIYGLARANYIPQLFSLRLPNPDIIYELLREANARALIIEPSFRTIVQSTACPVPAFVAELVAPEEYPDTHLPSLDMMKDSLSADDTVLIFHTSGSTSGSPKLVPCSLRWLDSTISAASTTRHPIRTFPQQDVTVWTGSMCHMAQNFMLLGSLQHGACTVQPTALPFQPSELADMVARCSLNRLTLFASTLGTLIRAAKADRKTAGLLNGMDEVLYTGLSLAREELAWAMTKKVKLRNMFGSTECGAMLLSAEVKDGDEARPDLLRPIEGIDCAFVPVVSIAPPQPSSPTQSAPEHTNANTSTALLELVVLSTSGTCPHHTLRASDGHFHTGDLFLAVPSGTSGGATAYVSRGRNDDWIKSATALRCDTRAIEDNVRATCGDLVAECVVVGEGRPNPVLFVETHNETPCEEAICDGVKREIIRRTRAFHARRYLHERIVDANFVVVVPRGSLLRTATKGNVRRGAVEEKYRQKLNAIYGTPL